MLRERLEKLRMLVTCYQDIPATAYPHERIYNRCLDDVESLLDEHLGELVVEDEAGKLIACRIGDLLEKNIRPGDRIAIYVRRESLDANRS